MNTLLTRIVGQEASRMKREATTTEIAHALLEMAETFAHMLVSQQLQLDELENELHRKTLGLS